MKNYDFFFLKGKYTTSPTIFVTAEHHRAHLRHDAATVWLENASARSFKICIRELQNFAGVHDDISVVSLYWHASHWTSTRLLYCTYIFFFSHFAFAIFLKSAVQSSTVLIPASVLFYFKVEEHWGQQNATLFHL